MKYCWLDLETTGLKHDQNNEIIEIAAIITDGFFNKLDSFHAIIKPTNNCMWHHEAVVMHNISGLLPEVLQATKTLEETLPFFIDFLKKHDAHKKSLTVAGNSVHFDINFLKLVNPYFDELFYHQHLDVSAVRVVVVETHGAQARFTQKSNHRAMDDLETSMAELDFYLKNFFKVVLQA
jgi:oligoribonuclease (3'-5' exoribonuclease)